MILVGYTHGLRVSELIGLQWSDVSFEDATLHIRRAKGGNTGSHPLRADEKRALRALQRQAKGTWVFSERGSPFTTAGFASLIERAGEAAKIGFKIHAHMLRHSAGYAAINADVGVRDLQDFLGHKSINSTTRYARQRGRFKSIVRALPVQGKLPFKAHPHMLRHATGFALANKGTDTRTLQAYLGHRSIQSSTRNLLGGARGPAIADSRSSEIIRKTTSNAQYSAPKAYFHYAPKQYFRRSRRGRGR